MKRISGLAAYLAMASAILSCSADKNLVPERTGDDRTVDLRAWRSHIITRAGDQTTDFGTGTKYALFIHDGAGWIRQCQGTDAAVETADHTIDYGALLTYGDSPLSFYGATYGDTDVVPPVSAGTSGRQLLVKQDIPDDGILPDLMTSRNLIDCTATTGNQLQMDFRHAFCRLNLYEDEEFFNENTTGMLILPDRSYELEIFACLRVSASEDAIFYPQQWQTNTDGLLEFVSENAMHIHQDTFDRIGSSEDFSQILAMSTCSSEFTDARTILLAVMKPYSPET